jgi:3-oxoacyl-[acyl-carrier-protein] synthase II
VVTGIGIASALGLSVETAFERLLTGQPAIGPPPPYELAGLRAPKNQKFLSPSARLFMWAGLQALDRSGWSRESLNPERTAIFTGSGQPGLEPSQMFPGFAVAHKADGQPDWAALGGPASRLLDPYFPLRALSNSGLALLAMELGARGPSNNFVQSDTAGVNAFDAAASALAEDQCDVVLCGAFDSLLTPANELNYRRMGLVSAQGRLRPFDREADGMVLGEAGVALLLERRADAEARGAPILASLSLAGAHPPDFIVAAGHGVPDLDREEAKSLAPGVPCAAFKGVTGYLGAATALVEAVLAIAALQARCVPLVVGRSHSSPIALPPGRTLIAHCLSRNWTGETGLLTVEV